MGQLFTQTYTNQTTSWLIHSWNIFGARANTNSQNSPWPKLGGSHHLPLYNILYAWPWSLHLNVILSQDSQVGSLEIRTPMTLQAHNVLCKPPIEVRFEAKLYPSLRAFQQYMVCHLHISKSERFPTFTSHESN